MTLDDLDQEGLRRLNSATKYPSIPTYHELDDRGRLLDTVAVPFDDEDELVITEKVDGTNARIIALPNARILRLEYIVGSRNDLLHARGDLVYNHQLGIVEALEEFLERLTKAAGFTDKHAFVFYGEVYGGNVGKSAREYTSDGSTGFRMFDVVTFDMNELDDLVRDNPPESISLWRKGGGQNFSNVESIAYMAEVLETPTVPQIRYPGRPPTSIVDTLDWLRELLVDGSSVGLDEKAGGRPEGVVVRTLDRSKIAKIRFRDYERTLRDREKLR